MNHRYTAPVLVALAFAVLLTACMPTSGDGGGGSDAPDGGDIDHPAGPTDVVLRMTSAGGFAMPEMLFSSVPQFTLYGDGTVIVPGAVPAIYPGPALPNLQVRRLTEDGIQALLRAVASTGLFGSDARFDGAAMFVADAPDTVFTVAADGATVEVSIYGLGTIDPEAPPPGMPAHEVAAYRALLQLSNLLSVPDGAVAPSDWADETWRPYEPASLRLSVRDATGEPGDGTESFAEWPIEAEDPTSFGEPGAVPGARCGVVTGDAAEAWLEVLASASQQTRFTADDHAYAVAVRPILPDEEPACPRDA